MDVITGHLINTVSCTDMEGYGKINTYIIHLRKGDQKRFQILRILQTVNRPMNPTDEEIIDDVLNYNFMSWQLVRVDKYENYDGLHIMNIGEQYQVEV